MIWFCEYSAEQHCFHVSDAADCVKINREMFMRGEKPSYVPLGLFPSREDAELFCRILQNKCGSDNFV